MSLIFLTYLMVKNFTKKALKFMPKEDSLENKVVIIFPPDLQSKLEKSISNFYMVSKTLKELNYLTSTTSDFIGNGLIIFRKNKKK
jgi:hypothetical protein